MVEESRLWRFLKNKNKVCDIMEEDGFYPPKLAFEPFIRRDNPELVNYLKYCRRTVLDMDEFIDFHLKQSHNPTARDFVNIMHMLMPLNVEESCLTPEVAKGVWNEIIRKYDGK